MPAFVCPLIDLEEEYLDIEEEVTALVASYVDDHLELFAKIVK